MAEGSLDYSPFRHGACSAVRGLRRRLEGEYIAVLGATETCDRFMEKAYPALLARIGLMVG